MSLARVVATWFGAGRAPVAPGTFGTLATVPIPLALWWLDAPYWLLPTLAVVLVLVGTPAAGLVARQSGSEDPSEVVVDESAGFLVACSGAPLGTLSLLAAFGLFRLFDIWKPGPIRVAERLPGGIGIMADDLLAGLGAAGCTWLARGLASGAWAPWGGP